MGKATTINGPDGVMYNIDGELYTGDEVINKYSLELKEILDKKDIYESPKEHPDQLKLDI